MNLFEEKFSEEEVARVTQLMEDIKHKKVTNVYMFRDFKKNYHIFHHTVDNIETHTGFEEGLFAILKELDIWFYFIFYWNGDKIICDKVDTRSSSYYSSITTNLE